MPWLLHLHRSRLRTCDRLMVITTWIKPSSKVRPLLKKMSKFSNTIYLNWRYNFVVLPAGTEILSAHHWGKSSWNTTVRINTLDPEKCEKQFFLKVLINQCRIRELSSMNQHDWSNLLQCAMPGEHGKMMMEGEFSAMTELYKFAPTFIPKPYIWGKIESAPPSTDFEFKDMISKLPDPKLFCTGLAKLHQNSVSPTGKFGFHIATTHGKLPQYMW